MYVCFVSVRTDAYSNPDSGFGMPGMYAINTVNGMALAGGQLGYPVNGYAPRTLGKNTRLLSGHFS